MRRKHRESRSTRETEKAREDEEEEEGRGKQREVLLYPVTRGGSVRAKPNRTHSKTDKRKEGGGEERPGGERGEEIRLNHIINIITDPPSSPPTLTLLRLRLLHLVCCDLDFEVTDFPCIYKNAPHRCARRGHDV